MSSFFIVIALFIGLTVPNLMFMTANAASPPSGTLSCGSSTASSISVMVSYANTGSAGASLYRKGAPANGQVAFFPGSGGTGSHSDNGLNGTYEYQLRSGTRVLVTSLYCATKPQPAPAPAPTPAPTPAPRPVTPAPTPPPAPAPTPAPQPEQEVIVTTPPPTPTEESNDDIAATTDADDNNSAKSETIVAEPSTDEASLVSKILPFLLGLFGLALISGMAFLFIKRRQTDVPVVMKDPDTISDITPIVPSSLPAPVVAPTANLFSELIPVPVEKANYNQEFNRSINSAFYPSMPVTAPVETPKADDIPDMYTVANEHPESYGNTSFVAEPSQTSTETSGIPFKR